MIHDIFNKLFCRHETKIFFFYFYHMGKLCKIMYFVLFIYYHQNTQNTMIKTNNTAQNTNAYSTQSFSKALSPKSIILPTISVIVIFNDLHNS